MIFKQNCKILRIEYGITKKSQNIEKLLANYCGLLHLIIKSICNMMGPVLDWSHLSFRVGESLISYTKEVMREYVEIRRKMNGTDSSIVDLDNAISMDRIRSALDFVEGIRKSRESEPYFESAIERLERLRTFIMIEKRSSDWVEKQLLHGMTTMDDWLGKTRYSDMIAYLAYLPTWGIEAEKIGKGDYRFKLRKGTIRKRLIEIELRLFNNPSLYGREMNFNILKRSHEDILSLAIENFEEIPYSLYRKRLSENIEAIKQKKDTSTKILKKITDYTLNGFTAAKITEEIISKEFLSKSPLATILLAAILIKECLKHYEKTVEKEKKEEEIESEYFFCK
ncbi:MAG: hypothetical protein HXS44_06450 [Theionarchaea archaeon]|nr:hypothetical protein [Theionarchaea archaeon]